MPLGIVTDEEFQAELDKLNGVKNDVAEVREKSGVGKRPEMPDSMRKVIIDEALEGTDRKTLARLFNVSEQTVSNSKTGNNGYSHDKNPEIKSHAQARREKIAERAGSRLIAALKALTPDKIAGAETREISAIAKDMSQIVRNMEPQEKSSGNSAQFVFFAPQMRKEEDFKIIEVRDN